MHPIKVGRCMSDKGEGEGIRTRGLDFEAVDEFTIVVIFPT